MNATIFIKTYRRDGDWLGYCLRSIKKFGSGYYDIVVASEEIEVEMDVRRVGCGRFVRTPQVAGSGYLLQQVEKLRADTYVRPGTTHIVYVDSDCFFEEPHTPASWCVNGLPRLIIEEYAVLGAVPWRNATKNALGWSPRYETMRCQPLIFDIRTLRETRRHLRRHGGVWWKWIMGQSVFSEFNVMGNVALREHPNLYHVIDFTNNRYKVPNVQQYWSHERVSEARKQQFEAHLR